MILVLFSSLFSLVPKVKIFYTLLSVLSGFPMFNFENILDKFRHVWIHLEKFGCVWNNFDKLRQVWLILNKFYQFWTSLINFGQVQSILDNFVPIWTSFDNFHPIKHNKLKWNIFFLRRLNIVEQQKCLENMEVAGQKIMTNRAYLQAGCQKWTSLSMFEQV